MVKFPVYTLTLEELKQIIANGDDTHDNQIRCTKEGMVFLSEDIVGADDIDNIAFRFETFDAGNDYVGHNAANDEKFMARIYKAIIDYRDSGCKRTYIDIF